MDRIYIKNTDVVNISKNSPITSSSNLFQNRCKCAQSIKGRFTFQTLLNTALLGPWAKQWTVCTSQRMLLWMEGQKTQLSRCVLIGLAKINFSPFGSDMKYMERCSVSTTQSEKELEFPWEPADSGSFFPICIEVSYIPACVGSTKLCLKIRWRVGAQRHPLSSAVNSLICTWTPQPTQESPSEILHGWSQAVCAVCAMCATWSPFHHSASCTLVPCLNSEGISASEFRNVVSVLHSLIGSWKGRTGTWRGVFKWIYPG